MLWAVTGHAIAEIVNLRSDPYAANMGLTAKNYLASEEITELDRIVDMYLGYAEDQATRRQAMTMADWAERLDAFLSFNERELLTHTGTV